MASGVACKPPSAVALMPFVVIFAAALAYITATAYQSSGGGSWLNDVNSASWDTASVHRGGAVRVLVPAARGSTRVDSTSSRVASEDVGARAITTASTSASSTSAVVTTTTTARAQKVHALLAPTDQGVIDTTQPMVQPLVPLSKLNNSESAKHLACQRASFVRHQRPHAAGGARFVIVQSNDFRGKTMAVPYTFNRAAWAEAFGHEFVCAPPPDGVHGYGNLASNKPRVLLAELRRHLGPLQPPRTVRAEWIVWMDADTFVNPDDPPDFEALMHTVTEDKVLLVTQTECVHLRWFTHSLD
jgi:hypothetical protein